MKEDLERKVKYQPYGYDPKYFKIVNEKDLYYNVGTIKAPLYQILKKNYKRIKK